MSKLKLSKRWVSLLLAVVLALPVLSVGSAHAAEQPSATNNSSNKIDYFGARYPALAGKEHVFETLTYYELDYLLRNAETGKDDNYIILFGGSWQAETQAAIGYINDIAKEYGITSIKNFDTKLDGPDGWIDIAKPSVTPPKQVLKVTTSGRSVDDNYKYIVSNEPIAAGVGSTDFSRRYVDLGARYLTNLNEKTSGSLGTLSANYTGDGSPGLKEVNIVNAPYLFIYNKGNTAAPIVASLEGLESAGGLAALQSGVGEEAYKNELRSLFNTISDPGTKNAHFTVLTNQSYISGSYNEFKSEKNKPLIFENNEEIVIDSVTLDELKYLLEQDQTIPILIGSAWCGDTQGTVKYVNRVAKEFGVNKVYNFDTKLDGGVGTTITSATNPRPVWGDPGPNFLQTRTPNLTISQVYVDLVHKYLTGLSSLVEYRANVNLIPNVYEADGTTLVSQIPLKHNNNRVSGRGTSNDITYYYKTSDGQLTRTEEQRASRLQAPYAFIYDYNKEENKSSIIGHVEIMGYWSNTYDKANTKSLRINSLRTLFSRVEWNPEGLKGIAPTNDAGTDGKIIGIGRQITDDDGASYKALKSLEYRLKGQSDFVAANDTEIQGLAPGVYEVRYAAKDGFDTENGTYTEVVKTRYEPGPVIEVIVPQSQAAPVNLVGLAPTTAGGHGKIVWFEDNEQKWLPAGLEYKLASDPETAYASVESDELIVPSGDYHVRYAAKIEGDIHYAPSPARNVYVPGYNELVPPSREGLNVVHPTTLDNNDGQITGLNSIIHQTYKLEYKQGNADGAQYELIKEEDLAAGKLTGLVPDVYSIRYAAYEDFFASPAIQFVIKGNVEAPTGLTGVAPTNKTQANGKIKGTNASLEYRSHNQADYQSVDGDEVIGLVPGEYYFRVKETSTTLPSAETKVTVAQYVAPYYPESKTDTGSGGTATDNNEPEGISQSGNNTVAAIAAKVDETSGTAIAALTPALVAELLKKSKEVEAKGEKSVLEIQVDNPQKSTNIQITIPRASYNELVAGTEAEVSINAGIGTIVFDSKALKSIGASSDKGDISIILSKSELTEEGKEVLGDRPVYDLLVFAGQTKVSTFGGSKLDVSLPYTLKQGEVSDALIVYYVNDEGELEVVRGQYNPTTKAVEFKTTHFSQFIVGYNNISFSDVDPSAWYASAVTFLAAREITSGTDDSHFSPNAKLSRGQFIVLLLNAYGIKPDSEGASNFADAGNTYYTGYLAAAKRLGIANGLEDNKFAPNKDISRQELFTLLYRALDVLGERPAAQANAASVESFADADAIPAYANEAFTGLVKAGVISGSNGKLLPGNATTRAEVAQVLYSLLKS
ncbi:S-layer homology domain-containing protein [Paenibacillus sp. GCM10012307]|uniref:S-layer homology domain-containing protein n=1 Tax=Paenibacillus roseus TaxID=2798579 RepID=A0A934J3J9_9BACL|nr:S-layer homology domain-containing protein [Paenibacillus roseus]MBJ6360186.1 S-layer homology domain-containing protein [Paenibacillus roseus]